MRKIRATHVCMSCCYSNNTKVHSEWWCVISGRYSGPWYNQVQVAEWAKDRISSPLWSAAAVYILATNEDSCVRRRETARPGSLFFFSSPLDGLCWSHDGQIQINALTRSFRKCIQSASLKFKLHRDWPRCWASASSQEPWGRSDELIRHLRNLPTMEWLTETIQISQPTRLRDDYVKLAEKIRK
jgi:hypothetical protein